MKRLHRCLPLTLLLASSAAHASFFFFSIPIPGGKAKPGELCVSASTKVGDVKTNANGNTLTIRKLSGTSSECKQDGLPILAVGEYGASTTFSSKAGIGLPDDYKPESLTEFQKYSGVLLVARKKSTNATLRVTAIKSEIVSDVDTYAANLEKYYSTQMDDAKPSAIETIVVNDLPARRCSIDGKVRNVYGTRVTYLITILQGSDEIVLVEAWAPSARYAEVQPELQHAAYTVVGVHPPAPVPPRVGAQAAATAGGAPGASAGQEGDHSGVTGDVESRVGPSSGIPEQRLKALNQLLKDGLINQQEYDAKRAEIIKSM